MGFPQAGNTLAVTIIGVQGRPPALERGIRTPICSFRDLREIRRMAAANGTKTAAMLGRVEKRISRADRGCWVQLRGVSTASRLLGQCRRSRRR